jgi:olfactory receptor
VCKSPKYVCMSDSCFYVCGFLNVPIYTWNILRLLCEPNEVGHFFCDASPLLALSYSETYISEMVIKWLLFSVGGFSAVFCILVILIFYLFIIITIMKTIHLQDARWSFLPVISTSVQSLYFVGQ